MHPNMFDSKPINCGRKGKGLDWNPLKEHMQQRLGHTLSLSQKLSRDELDRLGFVAAANGLYPIFQGGYDGRKRNEGFEEGMYGASR